jgi:L-aspartate oxidase
MLPAFDERRYLIPFRSMLLPHVFTDTLVVGGGVAGMRAAIAAAEGGDVILLVKDRFDVSATAWARGGIAVARDETDVAAHAEDTIGAGAGLCNEAAVRALTSEGPAALEDLLSWGMRFDRDEGGDLDRGREAAHRCARVLHSGGAATGRELVRCLRERVGSMANVRIFDECFALDLLTAEEDGRDGRVLGAITHHPRYGLQIIWAKATILATGGAGQVYRETSNPKCATGDGTAMAYRAGAAVADLEFMQFHPTTLYVAGAPRVLISEAVRGEGATLVDRDGVRFMTAAGGGATTDDRAELAPRDVVSRAIVAHLARTGAEAVYLDARHLGRGVKERFPDLVRELAAFDLDPAEDLIPVHPAAHYTIGGVWTDLDGRATLAGLFACGEAACTGLHGANRLASNSLLEGLVFGRRAGRAAAAAGERALVARKIVSEVPVADRAELDLVDVRSSLRSAMWRNVGIERSGPKLDDVMDMFAFWARYTMDAIFDDPDGWETQNMLTVGALITGGARWREESRGVHWRRDFPHAREEFAVHARWRTGEQDPVQPAAAAAGARGGTA